MRFDVPSELSPIFHMGVISVMRFGYQWGTPLDSVAMGASSYSQIIVVAQSGWSFSDVDRGYRRDEFRIPWGWLGFRAICGYTFIGVILKGDTSPMGGFSDLDMGPES